MHEIIELSQEILTGIPVFPGLPEVAITMIASHEQRDGFTDSDVVSLGVNRLELGEYTQDKYHLQRTGVVSLHNQAPSSGQH